MQKRYKIVEEDLSKCHLYGCEFCENNQPDKNLNYQICPKLKSMTFDEYVKLISDIIFKNSSCNLNKSFLLADYICSKIFINGVQK